MFKRFSILAIAGVSFALAAPGAYAQSRTPAAKKSAPAPATVAPASSSGIGEGDTELNFFGSLSSSDATDSTTIIAGVGIGKFVSDDLQLKLTQVMIITDDIVGYSPYVSAEYQIRPQPGSPFVAYVGGGAGLNLLSGTDVFTYSLFLTPVGGFKYFLNERMSLTYSLSYQFPLLEETCGTFDCYDSETTTLQNTLGFSIYY